MPLVNIWALNFPSDGTHFSNSSHQFATREHGVNMTHLAFCFKAIRTFTKVCTKATTCSVFPSPIECAKMQPLFSETHDFHMNWMPSAWWGFKFFEIWWSISLPSERKYPRAGGVMTAVELAAVDTKIWFERSAEPARSASGWFSLTCSQLTWICQDLPNVSTLHSNSNHTIICKSKVLLYEKNARLLYGWGLLRKRIDLAVCWRAAGT